MDFSLLVGAASAGATIFAGVALFLSYRQLRQLDQSIRGNTYQQLAQSSQELHRVLLEHPEVHYLYTSGALGRTERAQAIFDRLLASYLENIWYQRKLGLLDDELVGAYDALLKDVVEGNAGAVRHISSEHFVASLRQHIKGLRGEGASDELPRS